MYIPPLRAICENIGISAASIQENAPVAVPAGFLRFLLQLAVAAGDFNEQGYLDANPDIVDALKKGALDDPRVHYIKYGYFEGRRGASPSVDEKWYRRTYSDVNSAIASGAVSSGREHFETAGCIEGRCPSAAYELDVREWRRALARS